MSNSRARSYAALTAVFAGVFVAADDQTVVVTVLPEIMLDLKLTVTELDHTSWIITGYLLGYVAAMPLIGRLSDIWGHRNAFIGSLLLFMLGSVGVALATDINWLIGLRVFQALGAGALVPIAIAIVGDLFPPERRGTPLGLVGASAEAGGVIGPLWGGVITKYLAWQWVFWMNIPLCAVIIALTLVLLPQKPALSRKGGLHRRRARYGKPRRNDPWTSANRRPRRADGAVVRTCGSIACAVHRAATHRC